MSEQNDHEVPAELAEIAGVVAALGAADRGAAPAGLGARVFEATRGMLGAQEAPLMFVRAKRTPMLTRMRVAAGVALLVGTTAIWLGEIGTPSHRNTLEDDVDLMLAMRHQDATVSERIDMLFSDTAALRDSLRKNDELDGESM
jgi:hypothetical protein